MTEQNAVTLEHVLYAQALQIATSLSGPKPDIMHSSNFDYTVDKYLEEHSIMTKKVIKYILSHDRIRL